MIFPDIDVPRMLQVMSAFVLGGVLGWFISYLAKAKYPMTVVAILVGMSLFYFVIS